MRNKKGVLHACASTWALCAALTVAAAPGAADVAFPEGEFFVPPDPATREVIGSADFEKLRSFARGSNEWRLGRKIAYLRIGGRSSCSGSLVGPDLLLTNHHCIVPGGALVPPEQVVVYMDYYDDNRPGAAAARGREHLRSSAMLDYALLRLDVPLGDTHGWLRLDPAGLESAREVRLISHPRARSKEIVRRNTRIVQMHAQRGVVHYLADSEPGSSGSPVFSADGDAVIALHHAGNLYYNEGILIAPIHAQISGWLPGAPAVPTAPGTAPAELPAAWRKLIAGMADAARLPLAPDRGRYRVGQEMRLTLELPREGFLNVVAIDERGEATVLFPNRHERDNRRPRETLVLPTARMPFAFVATPPAGRQLIVGILSEEPLDLFEAGITEADAVFAGLDRRGLDVLERSARARNVHAAYVIAVIEQ